MGCRASKHTGMHEDDHAGVATESTAKILLEDTTEFISDSFGQSVRHLKKLGKGGSSSALVKENQSEKEDPVSTHQTPAQQLWGQSVRHLKKLGKGGSSSALANENQPEKYPDSTPQNPAQDLWAVGSSEATMKAGTVTHSPKDERAPPQDISSSTLINGTQKQALKEFTFRSSNNVKRNQEITFQSNRELGPRRLPGDVGRQDFKPFQSTPQLLVEDTPSGPERFRGSLPNAVSVPNFPAHEFEETDQHRDLLQISCLSFGTAGNPGLAALREEYREQHMEDERENDQAPTRTLDSLQKTASFHSIHQEAEERLLESCKKKGVDYEEPPVGETEEQCELRRQRIRDSLAMSRLQQSAPAQKELNETLEPIMDETGSCEDSQKTPIHSNDHGTGVNIIAPLKFEVVESATGETEEEAELRKQALRERKRSCERMLLQSQRRSSTRPEQHVNEETEEQARQDREYWAEQGLLMSCRHWKVDYEAPEQDETDYERDQRRKRLRLVLIQMKDSKHDTGAETRTNVETKEQDPYSLDYNDYYVEQRLAELCRAKYVDYEAPPEGETEEECKLRRRKLELRVDKARKAKSRLRNDFWRYETISSQDSDYVQYISDRIDHPEITPYNEDYERIIDVRMSETNFFKVNRLIIWQDEALRQFAEGLVPNDPNRAIFCSGVLRPTGSDEWWSQVLISSQVLMLPKSLRERFAAHMKHVNTPGGREWSLRHRGYFYEGDTEEEEAAEI